MIFAIKPFEIHDGDGIRTTVFFKGCPLRCRWCHNPESFSPKRELLYDPALCVNCLRCTALCAANGVAEGRHTVDRAACTLCGACEDLCPGGALELCGREATAEEIAEEVLRDELILKESGGGVTFSGGEPLLQPELCVALAKLLKARGLHIAIDTCAHVSRAAIDAVLPYADAFLFDIKAMDEEVHRHCTGVSNRLILDNIRYVDSLGVPMEIRYPYVPGMNDGEADAIAAFVSELKHVTHLRVLGYHNYAERKYDCLGLSYPLPDVPVPTAETLARVREKMHAEA